ncbi:HNH endonuclease family protein [Actinocatenispora thailandica]|uniref:HNH endonuclease family protein n=1 Tax=Actinocatenispora thailandica TaxID=227318 RepID=UPI00194DF8DD|nr:HNH endonuclease family protein [Actinocatenispora thailandica]
MSTQQRPLRRTALVVAVVLVLAAAGCGPTASGAGLGPSGSPNAVALAQLAKLTVRAPGSMAGYRRDRYGPAWADVDHNGCDTRDDVLARDLTAVRRDSDGCTVLSGSLHDPYTGRTIAFRRGARTSTAVQIDHLVPLANAWRTGARGWSADKRKRLANDPANLVAVDGPANESKGDQDASTWLPPNVGYRCRYVAGQVRVKANYGLWVTPAEHDAIARILHGCGAGSDPGGPDPSGPDPSAPDPSAPGTGVPSSGATSAAPTVHPGSWCGTPDARGRTAGGTAMVCTGPAGERPRWRTAN